MINYIQETQDDNMASKINHITMTYWYDDSSCEVHAYMKRHKGGILTMGKR